MKISNDQAGQENAKLIVCINAYNHEKFISKAIESALMQDVNFNYLIYIHDDASTDGTQKIIKKYAEKYPGIIKTFFQKENQFSKGISPFVRDMLPRMKSKYIAGLDGDDYWTDKSKLQKQYDILESNENCMLVHHNSFKIFASDQKKELYHKKIIGTLGFEDILKQNKIIFSSVVFRNINLDNFIIAASTTLFTDRPLWIYLLKHGHAFYMNENFSNYLIHDKGIDSSEKYHDKLKNRLHARQKLLDIKFNERESELIIKSILRLRFLIIIISLIKLQRKEFFFQVRELFIFNNKIKSNNLMLITELNFVLFIELPSIILNRIIK